MVYAIVSSAKMKPIAHTGMFALSSRICNRGSLKVRHMREALIHRAVEATGKICKMRKKVMLLLEDREVLFLSVSEFDAS